LKRKISRSDPNRRERGRMSFEVISPIEQIETIAVGRSIREWPRLRRIYGAGRWRKMKGFAWVKTSDARILYAEIHRYEAHGIGRKELKLKRVIG
jgi:hypothetical protein